MIHQIKKIAQANKNLIGIGISSQCEHIERTLKAAESSAEKGFAEIVLVGDMDKVATYPISNRLQLHHSKQPERTLVELLKNQKVAGIVRGSLSSSSFLKEIKQSFQVSNLFRIALLETASGFCFFFAPVGIDEGETIAGKITLVRAGVALLKLLNMENEPIAILSGGRIGDLGRNPRVDKSIKEAEEVVTALTEQGIPNIHHCEILIEEAIASQCRVIVAPDGISGNLIYRTLVHLGKGKSHGAWYYNLPHSHPVVDTSRVGPVFEYESAIALASALATKSSKGS